LSRKPTGKIARCQNCTDRFAFRKGMMTTVHWLPPCPISHILHTLS